MSTLQPEGKACKVDVSCEPDPLDELLKADFTESFNSFMSEVAEQYNQDLIWLKEFLEGYSVESMD